MTLKVPNAAHPREANKTKIQVSHREDCIIQRTDIEIEPVLAQQSYNVTIKTLKEKT